MSEKGRKVYKFLVHNPEDEDGVYHSPYYSDCIWSVGDTKDMSEFNAESHRDAVGFLDESRDLNDVNGGVYHAYMNEKDAMWFGACWKSYYVKKKFTVVVGEFTIPETSKYVFIGLSSGCKPSFASESLRFDKILAEFNNKDAIRLLTNTNYKEDGNE